MDGASHGNREKDRLPQKGQAIPVGHRPIPYFAAMAGLFLSRLVRTWLVVATVDGLFASALSVFAYKSTVTRLWQGVAAAILGPSAFTGGLRTACIGVLLHLGVALGWSALFLAFVTASRRLRRVLASPVSGCTRRPDREEVGVEGARAAAPSSRKATGGSQTPCSASTGDLLRKKRTCIRRGPRHVRR